MTKLELRAFKEDTLTGRSIMYITPSKIQTYLNPPKMVSIMYMYMYYHTAIKFYMYVYIYMYMYIL